MREKRALARPKIIDDRQNLIVGGVRNEFGTRISRKVVCEKCKQVDHVPVARSKKATSLYCRSCAQSEIGAFEKGIKIKPEMQILVCAQCGKGFDFPKSLAKQSQCLCRDCYSGFEVWNGSLSTPLTQRASTVLQRRPSGTALRKRTLA